MSDNDKTNPDSTEQLSLSDAKVTAEIKQIESSIKREDRKFALEFIKTVILAYWWSQCIYYIHRKGRWR